MCVDVSACVYPNTPACMHVSNMRTYVCVCKHACVLCVCMGVCVECEEHRRAAMTLMANTVSACRELAAAAKVRLNAAGFPSQTTRLPQQRQHDGGCSRPLGGPEPSPEPAAGSPLAPRAGGRQPRLTRTGFSRWVRLQPGEEGQGLLSFSWASHTLWGPPRAHHMKRAN